MATRYGHTDVQSALQLPTAHLDAYVDALMGLIDEEHKANRPSSE